MPLDGFVQVPPDSTGKLIDTTELQTVVGTVERQRVVIPDGVVVSSDTLTQALIEYRITNLLLAQGLNITDNLDNLRSDLSKIAVLSATIGGSISLGTAGRVLFEGPGPVLADDANFLYNSGTQTLSVPVISGGSTASSTLTLQSTTGIGTSDAIIFKTAAQVEAARIDNSGALAIGTTDSTFLTTPSKFVIAQNPTAGYAFVVGGFGSNSFAVTTVWKRTRGASHNANGILQNFDVLGELLFDGNDGTQFLDGAQITAFVHGTPATNSLPVGLRFRTSPTNVLTDALVLSDTQDVITSPQGALATSATQGFLYVGSCAGAPTGTPGTTGIFAGQVPMVFDTTNTKLWGYFGSWVGLNLAIGNKVVGGTAGRILYEATGPVLADSSNFCFDGTNQIIGSNTALTFVSANFGGTPIVQALGLTANTGFLSARYSATSTAGKSFFVKTRGTTVGDYTVVQQNDRVGTFVFLAADGTNTQETAAFGCEVEDATPSGTSMAGRLIFYTTPAGTVAVQEGARLDSASRFILSGIASSFFGAGSQVGAGANSYRFQVHGVDANTGGQGTFRWAADANPAYISLHKSRGTTIGDYTITAVNDTVGKIRFTASDGAAFQDCVTIYGEVDATPAANSMSGRFIIATTNAGTSAIARLRVDSAGNTAVISGTLGYGTGVGGTVTQATSRTTGVTLNNICGAITMFSAAGSATAATFTVTNSTVAATDTIILDQKSGTNLYEFLVTAVAAGSFNITFRTTGGTATDAPVINFAVIKAVTA